MSSSTELTLCVNAVGGSEATTTEPAPGRRTTSPRSVIVRNASRTVWRLASKRLHSSSSGGSSPPTGNTPVRISSASWCVIAWYRGVAPRLRERPVTA